MLVFSGTKSGRRRHEPMVIPVSIVDEGCRRIADNICEFTENAGLLVALDEEIVNRRVAEILVMHAMDEAGKLLEIIKKTIEAQHAGATSISVEGFYSHARKGSRAGGMGILAIDWLESVVEELPTADPKGHREFEAYRIHLEELKKDFSGYRERLLYVDFSEGQWRSPVAQDGLLTLYDSFLLGLLAALTLDTLNAGRPIQDLDKIARNVSGPDILQKFQNWVNEGIAGNKTP